MRRIRPQTDKPKPYLPPKPSPPRETITNSIHNAICAELGFAAVIPSAALAEDKKAEASIERQERIISLREKTEEELGFTLELIIADQGLDSLFLNTSNLQANEEMCSIYVCWLDEPAAPGGWPLEKRIEQNGRISGNGRNPKIKGRPPSVSHGKSPTFIPLNARHTDLGDYYGRGSVYAMAVSAKEIYASNIVTLPGKPEEAVKPQAEELRAGENKSKIVRDKTNAGGGK